MTIIGVIILAQHQFLRVLYEHDQHVWSPVTINTIDSIIVAIATYCQFHVRCLRRCHHHP